MAAAGGVGKLVSEMLTKAKILPDVVSQLPPEVYNLVVMYREVEVENGVHLRVAGTQMKPHVELRGKSFGGAEDKWTLLMVDPDAPSPESPTARNFLHWLVVNIPGSTAPNQGTHHSEYVTHFPNFLVSSVSTDHRWSSYTSSSEFYESNQPS